MATPPFSFATFITDPGDADIVAQHPADERAFRDEMSSAFKVAHTESTGHLAVATFDEQGSDPTVVADDIAIYAKDDSGQPELFHKDEAGAVNQLTMDGGTAGEFLTLKKQTSDPGGVADTVRIWAKVATGRTLPEVFLKHGTGSAIRLGNDPGDIKTVGGALPAGWLECDGTAVSRTTYADLFDAVGTTFGVGDGSTTFNLPDLRGRSPVGLGTGDATGATAWTMAEKGGEETHTLTTGEIPDLGGFTLRNFETNDIVASAHGATTVTNSGTNPNRGSQEGGTVNNRRIDINGSGGAATNWMHPVLGVRMVVYAGV